MCLTDGLYIGEPHVGNPSGEGAAADHLSFLADGVEHRVDGVVEVGLRPFEGLVASEEAGGLLVENDEVATAEVPIEEFFRGHITINNKCETMVTAASLAGQPEEGLSSRKEPQ